MMAKFSSIISFLLFIGFISTCPVHTADGGFGATKTSRHTSTISSTSASEEKFTHYPEGRWNKEWLEGQRESAAPAISNNGLDYYLSNGREGIFRTIIDRLYGDFLVGLDHEESLPYDPLDFVLHNDREIAKKSEYATLLRGVNQYLWSGKYFKIAQMPEAFERETSSYSRCMATIIRAYEESPGKETLAKLYEANTPTREDKFVLIAHLAVVATVHYEATRVYYPLADRIPPKGNIIWALDTEENKIVLKSEPEAPLNLLDLVTKFEGWKEEINRAFLEAKNLLAREDDPTTEPLRTRRHSIASPGQSTMPHTSPRRSSVTASGLGAAGISLATAVTARRQLPAGGLLDCTGISAIAQRSGSRDSQSSVGGDGFEVLSGERGDDDEEEKEEDREKKDDQHENLKPTSPDQSASSRGEHRVTPEVRRKWVSGSAAAMPDAPPAAAARASNPHHQGVDSAGDLERPLIGSSDEYDDKRPATPTRSGPQATLDGEQVMGEPGPNGYRPLHTPPRNGDKKSKKGKAPKKDEAATPKEGCCCVVM